MTPQHFKEIVETLCTTFHVTKKELSEHLLIHPVRLSHYQRHGIPSNVSPMIGNRLRTFMIDRL